MVFVVVVAVVVAAAVVCFQYQMKLMSVKNVSQIKFELLW